MYKYVTVDDLQDSYEIILNYVSKFDTFLEDFKRVTILLLLLLRHCLTIIKSLKFRVYSKNKIKNKEVNYRRYHQLLFIISPSLSRLHDYQFTVIKFVTLLTSVY